LVVVQADAEAAQAYIDTCSGAKYQSDSFGSAMNYTWMGNGYAWDFFLIPLCVSLGCLKLCAALNWALQRYWKQPAVRAAACRLQTRPEFDPASQPVLLLGCMPPHTCAAPPVRACKHSR
jgi:hypothetical protein